MVKIEREGLVEIYFLESQNIPFKHIICNYLSTVKTYSELLSNCALTLTPIAASTIEKYKKIFEHVNGRFYTRDALCVRTHNASSILFV
jgi:hypothetical protein